VLRGTPRAPQAPVGHAAARGTGAALGHATFRQRAPLIAGPSFDRHRHDRTPALAAEAAIDARPAVGWEAAVPVLPAVGRDRQ
jgi:hypothetical protein